jgi:hypothetical protein
LDEDKKFMIASMICDHLCKYLDVEINMINDERKDNNDIVNNDNENDNEFKPEICLGRNSVTKRAYFKYDVGIAENKMMARLVMEECGSIREKRKEMDNGNSRFILKRKRRIRRF